MVGFHNGHKDKIKLDKSYQSIPRFRKTDAAAQIEKKVSAINLTAHTTTAEPGTAHSATFRNQILHRKVVLHVRR